VVVAFEGRYDLASGLDEGSASIDGVPATYSTITRAIELSPKGGLIVLSPGVFRESVVLAGKDLAVAGAGPDKTFIVASETAVFANRSNISLSGLSLVSLTVGPDVAVAAISESTADLSDCRFTGGTGPGLIVAGRSSKVRLTGNVFSGNMGGGMRIQGGEIRLLRNTVVRNAQAGIVLSPTAPGAVSLSLWHDTILDNWGGHRCVSFSHSGVVPIAPLDAYSFDASIFNSGGFGETFSESFYGTVKDRGRNFFSVPALPAEDFFVDPGALDFRPAAPLVKDALGIELGAFASAQGRSELVSRLSAALLAEKLHIAWLVSLFLSPKERAETTEKIRGALYAWLDDFLRSGRLGSRLLTTLGLQSLAPRDWRLDVILSRFLEQFSARYTFSLKPINFFPENESFGQAIVERLRGRTSLFPRYIVPSADSPNSFVLTGRIVTPFAQARSSRTFAVTRQIHNPFFDKIVGTITMLESRLQENRKKRDDIQFTLDNPHVQQGPRYRASLEKQLETVVQDGFRLEAQLEDARKQLAATVPEFKVEVKGKINETLVKGEVFITLVAAPAGDIMLDESRALSYRHTSVEIEPIPEFDFPGAKLAGEFAQPEDQASGEITQLMLKAMIEKETYQLRHLLEQFRGGIIDLPGEDRLVELLLLNSPLLSESMDLKREYQTLSSAGAQKAPEIEVTVSYDPAKGSDRKGVKIDVVANDPEKIAARVRDLEAIYKPYWELEDLVSNFMKTRFGLTVQHLLAAAEALRND